jgi:putative membrane protein insertion efficiency factor
MLPVLLGLLVIDINRPPESQISNRILIGVVHGYRATLSPVLSAAGVRCRMQPSCSQYALIALRELGAARGSWWSARRLIRCGPWTANGTLDPPPTRSCAEETDLFRDEPAITRGGRSKKALLPASR